MSRVEPTQPLDLAEAEVPRWLRNPRTRKLLLGDWHPLVRDPIDVLRFALLIGAALLLILDKSLEAAPLATVLIVLAPRFLDLPRPLDLAVVVGMSLQAWGNLFDFFDRFGWYDDVVHFMLPMLTCAASYIALAQFQIVPRPGNDLRRADLGVGLVTFLIGMGYAALYEIYEAGADWILGTDPPLQDSLADTNTDLLFGALGSTVGALVLTLWYVRGYGVLRRLPPDAVVALIGNASARRRVRDLARSTGQRS
jgi:hypothetical protein